MRRFFILIALTSFVIAGCNPGKPSDKEGPVENPLQQNKKPATEIRELDIGDVETSVVLRATLAEASAGPGIKVDPMETPRGDLVLVTIDVSPPAPPELLVEVNLKCSSDFKERPVAVQGRILREVDNSGEKTELKTFTAVLGENARLIPQPGQAPPAPRKYEVNVLDGLAAPPETLLVVAETKLLMLSSDTPENLVDPASATADEGDTAIVMSNPVRINFGGAEGSS